MNHLNIKYLYCLCEVRNKGEQVSRGRLHTGDK